MTSGVTGIAINPPHIVTQCCNFVPSPPPKSARTAGPSRDCEIEGQPRSPLGDLVAQAAIEGRPLNAGARQPAPLHGYHYRILTAQGANAPGGAFNYIVSGKMSKGFAMVAWPAQYDATGIMTFLVNQDGIVYEKDLGPDGAKIAQGMTSFNPDATWHPSE